MKDQLHNSEIIPESVLLYSKPRMKTDVGSYNSWQNTFNEYISELIVFFISAWNLALKKTEFVTDAHLQFPMDC